MSLTATYVNEEAPDNDKLISWLGGDPSNPSRDDYLAAFQPDGREVVEAVWACHQRDGLDVYGEDMNDNHFLLSDGRTFSLSWRAWGDLRQAMEDRREGYMTYYMRPW